MRRPQLIAPCPSPRHQGRQPLRSVRSLEQHRNGQAQSQLHPHLQEVWSVLRKPLQSSTHQVYETHIIISETPQIFISVGGGEQSNSISGVSLVIGLCIGLVVAAVLTALLCTTILCYTQRKHKIAAMKGEVFSRNACGLTN